MQIKAGKVLILQMTPLISNSHYISSPAFTVRHPSPLHLPSIIPLSLCCHAPQGCLFGYRHNLAWDVASCTCGEAGGGGTEGANATRGEAPASAGKQRGASPL